MAMLPKKPCRHPGCPKLVERGYCSDHAGLYDQRRGSPASRGYGHSWRKLRALFLKRHPLCCVCGREATDVDHIVPKAMGGADDWSNLQALCHEHHSGKTAQQSSGWGSIRGKGG